jgi:hypothetical protein
MADESCKTCDGTGYVPCERCRGRGGRHAHRYRPVGFDPMRSRSMTSTFEWTTCPECEGRRREPCPDCGDPHDDSRADVDPVEDGTCVRCRGPLDDEEIRLHGSFCKTCQLDIELERE